MSTDGVQVKICGVNSEAAFDSVVEAAANYLGFVFFERSPRFVTAAQAASLSARHQSGPKRVGLFVAPDIDAVQAVLGKIRLDILQVYGSEEICRDIQTRFALPVWRAIGIAARNELPANAQGLSGFVIEAKAPPEATRPGGNATRMDWNLLNGWKAPSFWMLGGGLRAENVAQAILQSGAPAVDVSSGVETAPGQKSPAMIRAFIAKVRADFQA